MSAELPSIPTPSEWVERKLRELQVSNSALARIIGQDRTQVQRWINGREQIPRHHLAEIAVQLGDHVDLEYALKLKECEDASDSLKRKLRELARLGRFDLASAQSAVFSLLQEKTGGEEHRDDNDYASALMYNMTHASFIFRLWQEAASSRNFASILTPENLKLHVQYPANHFLGLALNMDSYEGLMPEFREQCLKQLRHLSTQRAEENPIQLSQRHHAIHILGRFGTTDDQAAVQSLLVEATTSVEPVSIRLGYAGLTLRPGHEDLAEKYLWLLQHDQTLAMIDVAFDAVHYGDVRLAPDQQLPQDLRRITRTIGNILRRLSQPDQYAGIRELDTFRLCMLLDRLSPSRLPDASLIPKIEYGLEQTLAGNRNKYTQTAESQLAKLLDVLINENPQ